MNSDDHCLKSGRNGCGLMMADGGYRPRSDDGDDDSSYKKWYT